MALGFRDCCNSASYFNVTGIPGTVSENEVYNIVTLEGPIFCATYTTIPVLNYSVPTYHLIEMTMQDNTNNLGCQNCISSNPCPAAQVIQISQFGPGSIATGTDCDIRTMYPMTVSCDITNPSFDGFADGTVRLVVTGGTYPYTFFSAGTQPPVYFGSANPDPNAPAPPDNTYIIIDAAAEGVYNITTVDAQADYVVNTTCILESPPAPLVVNATATNVSLPGECDATMVITIDGGTPPYTVTVNSIPVINTTLTNLCEGDYEITVIDSGEFPNQQVVTTNVTIAATPPPNYPTNLCFSIGQICSTTFNLDFQLQTGVYYNLRPVYECTNPQVLGLNTLLLRWEINVSVGPTPYTGWGIGLPFQISNGNVTFNAPCNQSPLNSFVRFVKTDAQSELPIGIYTTDVGFLSGINGNVLQGTCLENADPGGGGGGGGCTDPTANNYNPNATFDDGSCTYGGGGGPGPLTFTFTTTNAPCGQQAGSVIIFANGGVPPYTYFTNNGGGAVSSAVPTITLVAGNYTAYVVDSAGTQSTTQGFTITQLPTTPINMVFSSIIDTTDALWRESISSQGNLTNCYPCDTNTLTAASMRDWTYPININLTVSGLGPGQVVQGYFVITLKYQNVFSLSFPTCVANPNVSNPLGVGGNVFRDDFYMYPTGGLVYNGVSFNPVAGATTDNSFLPRSSSNISSNLLSNAQNTGCLTASLYPTIDDLDAFASSNNCNNNYLPPINTYDEYLAALQGVFNNTNVQTKTYQVADTTNPITMFNGTGQIKIYVQGKFRPVNENCPPAKGFQWEVQFFRTDTSAVCTTFYFNGAEYVSGGSQKYLASIKQVGAQEYPSVNGISNVQIIN